MEAERGEGGCEVAEPAVTVAARRGLRPLPRERGSPLWGDAGLAVFAAESSEKNRTELAKETRAGQGARAKRAAAR